MIWNPFSRKHKNSEKLSSTLSSYLHDVSTCPHWVPVLYQMGPEQQGINLAPLISNALEIDCNEELDALEAELTPEGREWLKVNRNDLLAKMLSLCDEVAIKQNMPLQEYPHLAKIIAKHMWEAMRKCP